MGWKFNYMALVVNAFHSKLMRRTERHQPLDKGWATGVARGSACKDKRRREQV
jgi:hypothetical protein